MPGHTPLAQLQREGTKLVGPLSTLNMQVMDWERDYLPEFLWIGALAEDQGIDHFHDPYNAFLDAIDKVWSHQDTPLGLLSDFGLVVQEKRPQFLQDNGYLVKHLFHKPIGRLLAFYPECPASWLVQQNFVEDGAPLDPGVELGYLRSLVFKLLPGKTDFPARVRAVPLNRLLKHNKIFFLKDLKVVDAIPKYPQGCNEKEKFLVESMARNAINMSLQGRADLKNFPWSRYFWRHNYDLVICKEYETAIRGMHQVSPEQGDIIQEVLHQNAHAAREYLKLLRSRYRPDLYDPSRDEVLFGLFSRITRLFSLMMGDPNLWARDVGAIILRCLADSAITFGYLVVKGTTEDFKRFVEYGEGQQKLLMLHLQDNYPEGRSLDGLTAKDLSEGQGRFTPELIDIELGHWLKKDARRLATEAGMEKLYRLVYNPASGDVHGTWLALKGSNLAHCVEPLHRFHRLPSYSEPPFFVNVAESARSLYDYCVNIGIDRLGYPSRQQELRSIDDALRLSDDQGGRAQPK
jgi:hypothetical protein